MPSTRTWWMLTSDYEKAHGIQSRPMEEMTYYANHADEFAQKFLGGYFKKKTTTQTFM